MIIKASSFEQVHPVNASLSVWRYNSIKGPIIVRLKYNNITKIKYCYKSWVGSPGSGNFKAILKMPDGDIREVQLRSGDECINGSFCQTSEIEPGDEIEWVYVLTLANLMAQGRYLHPNHWIFNPGQYEVRVVSEDRKYYHSETNLPSIYTNLVSFNILPGMENPKVIYDVKQDWGRKKKLLDICIDNMRYESLFSEAINGKDIKKIKAIDILSRISQIDIADHIKVIELWNEYIDKYKHTTFSRDKIEIKCVLACLGEILERMNTIEARNLLKDYKSFKRY